MKTSNKRKIFFIHLLNDFSGSPKVLSQIIDIAHQDGHHLEIFTSDSFGFLSSKSAKYNYISYQWSPNKLLTLFRLLKVQLTIIFKLAFKLNRNDIVYINTLLPFGAALIGKIKGCNIIYHIHETSIKPPLLKRFLKYIAQKTASKAIYVSQYLLKTEPLKDINSLVIYNALDPDFLEKASKNLPLHNDEFNILMLCSLKKYKGVDTFVELSQRLPLLHFTLVVNASKTEVEKYFSEQIIPKNIEIHPVQKNVHDFYKHASLVLNLSDPKLWVETFGLTAIEAFAYHLPVIVPPVGGIAEIVTSENGYHIDMNNIEELMLTIDQLASNKQVYSELSKNAALRANEFNPEKFAENIKKILTD